jgi:hypothetical protein
MLDEFLRAETTVETEKKLQKGGSSQVVTSVVLP